MVRRVRRLRKPGSFEALPRGWLDCERIVSTPGSFFLKSKNETDVTPGSALPDYSETSGMTGPLIRSKEVNDECL